MQRAKKVLLLSIKAGAGHLRAAQALAEAICQAHPGVEVRHTDALSLMNPALRRTFGASYNKLVTKLPSVWGMIYESMERKEVTSRWKRLSGLVDRMGARRLVAAVQEFGPDRIVCTHYLPAEALASRRRRGMLRVPLHVTLTDYDIHVMWIHEGVDGYFVATDEMAYALQAKGTGRASVTVSGIPIDPAFARRYPSKDQMRRDLGLAPRVPTVLMSAGGFGFGNVDVLVSQMAEAAGEVQFLAVAGRNAKLRRALGAAAERLPGRIVPFGFVTNMHELMAASDLAVSKCGGLTSSECLAMGLPMVVVEPIPGQEERNSDYLLENGAAVRAHSAAHLIYKVKRLLSESSRLDQMSVAARRIARPRAAFDIAKHIVEGADSPSGESPEAPA